MKKLIKKILEYLDLKFKDVTYFININEIQSSVFIKINFKIES